MATRNSLSSRAWAKLIDRVFREEAHCWLCGRLVDQSLHHTHKMSRTVDHIFPGSTHPHLEYDRANLRLAHRRCNAQRGNAMPKVGVQGATTRW